MLESQFGLAGATAGLALAAGAGWSRSALLKHTFAQIVAGLVVGAVVAAALCPVLR